jgi:hypothetical protein
MNYLTAAEINDKIHHIRFHRVAASNYVVCTLTMENGAEIVATSPQGEQGAYKNAFDTVWQNETYLFHQRQYEAKLAKARKLADVGDVTESQS